MNTMGMITIAKFLEEHNASVNLMNLFEAMCSDFIKLQQETNAAQEKNIEAQHSGGVASKCGTANKQSTPCRCIDDDVIFDKHTHYCPDCGRYLG